jgi:hypothetical protein
MLNQHQAVVQATKQVLGSRFQSTTDIKTYITKEERAQVVQLVVAGFVNQEVEMTEESKVKYSDLKSLTNYTNGLVTNWFNKSKELNGNTKWEAKNPGARAGSKDEQIQEMKVLKQQLEAAGNTEGVAKVAAAINTRLTELKATKAQANIREVDLSKIPESLRDLVG